QITLVCGLCVGAAAYCAALTDLTAMVAEQSYLFITGPKVTKVVTGEEVTLDDLGGPQLHARKTGAAHAVVESEAAGIEWVKRVLEALEPQRPSTDPAGRPSEFEVPEEARRAYDMRKVLGAVFGQGW